MNKRIEYEVKYTVVFHSSEGLEEYDEIRNEDDAYSQLEECKAEAEKYGDEVYKWAIYKDTIKWIEERDWLTDELVWFEEETDRETVEKSLDD